MVVLPSVASEPKVRKRVTWGGMALTVVSSIIALANALIGLSGPIHVLEAQNGDKIIAVAAVASAIGAVLAGFGRSPLEPPQNG